MKRTLFEEMNSYGEKCKFFTHADEAMKFVEEKYNRRIYK